MNAWRLARIRAGLSQAQLAAKVGCHRQTVSQVERGVHGVRRELAEAWQAACGERDPRAAVVLWLHPSKRGHVVTHAGRAVHLGPGLAELVEDARERKVRVEIMADLPPLE